MPSSFFWDIFGIIGEKHSEEYTMELIYQDRSIVVCVKPAGVLSTDEPGGVPELVRAALGEPMDACGRCTGWTG